MGPGQPLTINVNVNRHLPTSGVTAVVADLTVLDPRAAGYLTIGSAGVPPTNASHLTFVAGQTATNRAFVSPSASGFITLYATAPTDIVVDLSGYFVSQGMGGSVFTPEITPVRICDTRGSNPSDLSYGSTQCNRNTSPGGPDRLLAPGAHVNLHVDGLGYVPVGATGVELNVQAVPPAPSTALASGASASVDPSSIPPLGGFATGTIISGLGPNGTVTIANVSSGPVDVVVDVLGWYSR